MDMLDWGRDLENATGNSTVLDEHEAEDEARFLTIALFMGTLLASQLLLYASRMMNQNKVPEAGLLLLFGVLIGGLINSSDHVAILSAVEVLTEFDVNVFFLLLLPPIIFDSGYNIPRHDFFANFGLIFSLAVFATIFSALFVGAMMFAATKSPSVFSASGTECFVFGALISATDPVTVIAVFNRLGVKPSLLVLVFGESILNDAIAIVLYRTMFLFDVEDSNTLTSARVLSAIGAFFSTLLGSVAVGVLVGFLGAFLFKKFTLFTPEMRAMESSLAICLPYASYSLAAGLEYSGIVSILFTGIVMAAYTKPNLSEESGAFLGETYHIVAHLAETFVFIYLGMSVFTGDGDWSASALNFGIVGLFACLIARALAVVPICLLANIFRSPAAKVTWKEIFVLWFAGLRGGMAFALAASSVDELDRASTGRVLESATTIIVFITVFLFGGSTKSIIVHFGLVDKSHKASVTSPLSPATLTVQTSEVHSVDDEDDDSNNFASSSSQPGKKLGEIQEIELGSLASASTEWQEERHPPGLVEATGPTETSVEHDRRRAGGNSLFVRIDRAILAPLFIRNHMESGVTVQDSYRGSPPSQHDDTPMQGEGSYKQNPGHDHDPFDFEEAGLGAKTSKTGQVLSSKDANALERI